MKRQIKDYPNYFASVNGHIYNLNGLELKESTLKTGYKQVSLCKNGKVYSKLVHRIILFAFNENVSNKPEVNHINGVKSDNRLENLEWNTRSENQKHCIKIGLRHTRGENNSQNKLNSENVNSIFSDKRKYKEIAEQYNISIPTISNIKRGYSWTHITNMIDLKKTGYKKNGNRKQVLSL